MTMYLMFWLGTAGIAIGLICAIAALVLGAEGHRRRRDTLIGIAAGLVLAGLSAAFADYADDQLSPKHYPKNLENPDP